MQCYVAIVLMPVKGGGNSTFAILIITIPLANNCTWQTPKYDFICAEAWDCPWGLLIKRAVEDRDRLRDDRKGEGGLER